MTIPNAPLLTRGSLARRRVLVALKSYSDGATCHTLAEDTGISMSGTRAALISLLEGSLVQRTAIRKGQGRPAWGYRVTAEGARLCARPAASPGVELLGLVLELDPAAVRQAVRARFGERLAAARAAVSGASASERISRVCDELRGEGYVVDVRPQQPDAFVLSITHCPILEVARLEQSVCAANEHCLSGVLSEFEVSTTAKMTRSGETCIYRLGPRTA